jgi:hypothetical protein
VPLVPALVMLGLVAGAHGDSKSDSLRCRSPRLKDDSLPSKSLGWDRTSYWRNGMASYPSRSSVLERVPLGKLPSKEYLAPLLPMSIHWSACVSLRLHRVGHV